MEKTVNIIIVDDHKLFREGLKFVLSSIENINVIAEASDGNEFLELLKIHKPDLILIDILMPGMDGIEATSLALQEHPDLKIIVLSMFDEEEYYSKMIQAGVKGFILKELGSDELSGAIKEVVKGNSYFSQELLRRIIQNLGKVNHTHQHSSRNNTNILTEREKEVLTYICQGMNNYEIADTLHLSHRTIEGHRAKLIKKTSTKNTNHLIMYALKNKLVEI